MEKTAQSDIPIKRFKCICSYDGTAYHGWQMQPLKVNIQGTIEKTLARILKVPTVKIHGSGRTDHGVHAHGQVFHCDLATRMSAHSILKALNSHLPLDIRILACRICASNFHARCSATGKEYRYRIWNERTVPPDKRLYYASVRYKLDVEAMRRAMQYFVGAHDFAAFACRGDRPMATTVRTIYECRLTQQGHRITFAIRGGGFLYKMVRGIVGFLIRIGGGHESPEAIIQLLEHEKVRTPRVPSAPPCGLSLWHVWYGRIPIPNPHNPNETPAITPLKVIEP